MCVVFVANPKETEWRPKGKVTQLQCIKAIMGRKYCILEQEGLAITKSRKLKFVKLKQEIKQKYAINRKHD